MKRIFKTSPFEVLTLLLVCTMLLSAATCGENREAALRKAAILGQHDRVNDLLENGTDPNAVNDSGNTALMGAPHTVDTRKLSECSRGGRRAPVRKALAGLARDPGSFFGSKSVIVWNETN